MFDIHDGIQMALVQPSFIFNLPQKTILLCFHFWNDVRSTLYLSIKHWKALSMEQIMEWSDRMYMPSTVMFAWRRSAMQTTYTSAASFCHYGCFAC